MAAMDAVDVVTEQPVLSARSNGNSGFPDDLKRFGVIERALELSRTEFCGDWVCRS